MLLRLVLGRAGSGKSRLCISEMVERLKKSPDGDPLIYIVPEQAAFQAEYALASREGLEGIIRAQVLSFRRLAWRVMQEIGGASRLFIDDTGKSMIMRVVLERLKGRLTVFKHGGGQAGLLDNLVQLHNEMKRSCLTIPRLKEAGAVVTPESEGAPGRPSLFKDKLKDLHMIFEEVDRELEGHYLDGEDYLTLLADNIWRSSFLEQAEVWVDGFYSFTNLEYRVLEELLQCCRKVTVALCSGDDYRAGEDIDELDPFYPSASACRQLQRRAKRCGAAVKKVVLPGRELPRFKGSGALGHLEEKLFTYPADAYNDKTAALPLKLVQAGNRRLEVEALAGELIRRARDEGCRWRDMAVISGDLDLYGDIIADVFTNYEIPYFLDQKRRVTHPPLVELVRSAMEVVNRNWRYEDLFRCIKTGLLLPRARREHRRRKWQERAAKLENYVLSFGIQGSLWMQEEPWLFRESDLLDDDDDSGGTTKREDHYLRMINRTRSVISRPLLSFQEKFKAAGTVREKTEAFFGLLVETGVSERLEKWSDDALRRGDPGKAREHIQVYNEVVLLMDQVVELMGDQKVSSAQYARILEAGLESMRLNMVPPSLDQVLVGDVERTRTGSVRYAFLLGVNDGVLPSRPPGDGVFSEEEREELMRAGFELAPAGSRRLLDEQFLIYMALTRASWGLWISYTVADEEGRALLPSLLVARLKELFPSLEEEYHLTGGDREQARQDSPGSAADGLPEGTVREEGQATAVLDSLVHPRTAISGLALKLGQWKRGCSLHPLWWEVYNWFTADEDRRGQLSNILQGVFYYNNESPLPADLCRELYGDRLRASVSRMEKFWSCPFSQFAAHGLGLKERVSYGLDDLDMGIFFHAVLRNVFLAVQEKKLQWEELGRETCLELVAEEVEKLAPRIRTAILLSSGRYRYLAGKLKEAVGRAVLFLAGEARRSEFKPVGVEISFGEGGPLPPLAFQLPNGCTVELAGRIDRVDIACGNDGRAYARIIDYKSGSAELKLLYVLHGISLQLLTYLGIVIAHSRSWLGENVNPAAVLYFRIRVPLINSNRYLQEEEIEREMCRRFRMKGRVLEDVEVARMMDRKMQYGFSDIVPVAVNKEGRFYRKAPVLPQERFLNLCAYVNELVREAALRITEGEVGISPYRHGKLSGCAHCPYKPVCQFDPLCEGNSFRVLAGDDEERLWQVLEGRLQKGVGNSGEQ